MAIRRAPLAQVRRKSAPIADNSAGVDAQLANAAGQAFNQWHMQKLQAQQVTESNTAMSRASQALTEFEQNIKDARVIDVDGKEQPIYAEADDGRSHLLSQMSDFHQKLRNELGAITTLPGSKSSVDLKLADLMSAQSLRLQDHEQDLFIEDQLVKTNEAADIMVDQGNYQGALEIYQDAKDAGVLTGKQFTNMRRELEERRDYMSVFMPIKNATSDAELAAVSRLLESPPASLSPEQISSFWRDIDLKQRQMDKEGEDAITEAQDNTFTDALLALSDPQQIVTISEVEQLKGSVTPSQFQTLVGLSRTQSQSGVDDVRSIRLFRSRIAMIGTTGLSLDEEKEAIRSDLITAMSGFDPVTGEERETSINPASFGQLLGLMETTSDRFFRTPQYRQAVAIGQAVILRIKPVGIEADISAYFESDSTLGVRYTDFTSALLKYVEQNPDADPMEWAKSNVWTYASDTNNSINQVHIDKIGERREQLGRQMIEATTDVERKRIMDQLNALTEADDLRRRKADQE